MKLPFAHLFSEKKRITKDLVNTSEEFGGAGTKKLGGFIQEEYNSDLQGLNGVQKYEEMRSSDASIGAVLLAAELPIRATKWRINPGRTNGEITPQDEEIAEFISNCLFDYLEDGSFDDFLRQSLTMLPFGFSVFEKVYKIKGDKIVLRKLAQRLQASIYKWETEDKQAGITQKLFWDDSKKQDTVSIPKQYLVIFSFRREGDNYEGRSILRTAYKHWYIKDSLYKIDAVKHERLGIGIPVITLPKGASDDDKKEAETILENLRGTEQTYVVLPSPDWKIEFMDLKGGAAADASKSIAHHDRQISKSILAQFIDLGAESSGGSYALSEDQSSLFTLGLTAIANQFSEVVNKQIIEELVRLNFNLSENQTFPYLDFAKIGDIDYEKLANTISSLVGVSALSVDEDLENHLREVLDLPEKVQKEVIEKAKAQFSEKVLEFSEDTKVEARVAKKIIDYLEELAEGNPVGISDVDVVLNNLKHELRMKISMASLLNKASDEEIQAVIYELIDNRKRWEREYPEATLRQYGFNDAEEAKYFKESKEIFNFLDIINTQNGK